MLKPIAIFLIAVSIIANAKDAPVRYECPSVAMLTSKDGVEYFATTTYNGLAVNWYGDNLSEDQSSITALIGANANDCLQGICQVQCLYSTTSEEPQAVWMDIRYQEYAASKLGDTGWDGGICRSENPGDCIFYLVKHTW